MKFLPTLMLAASVLLATAAPAHAAPIFGENFDSEGAAGVSVLNYNTFDKFIVPNTGPVAGTVDLISSGGHGIDCAGGTGKCVDLDGSTSNAGALVSKTLFSFGAGDIVTLTFDLSGNQRILDQRDFWFAGFSGFQGSLLSWSSSATDAGCGSVAGGAGSANGIFVLGGGSCATFGGDPFSQRSLTFQLSNAGQAVLIIGDAVGADNVGAILDNVVVSRTSRNAVPEPATWAMMILGFGLVGGAMRRKRQVTVAYA